MKNENWLIHVYKSWKERTRDLMKETQILYYAALDTRTPWYAKAIVMITFLYAISPIDLIPDFIPILGYLDDLLLIPLGLLLARRMIPDVVLNEYRQGSKGQLKNEKSLKKIAALLVIFIWFCIILLCLVLLTRYHHIHQFSFRRV